MLSLLHMHRPSRETQYLVVAESSEARQTTQVEGPSSWQAAHHSMPAMHWYRCAVAGALASGGMFNQHSQHGGCEYTHFNWRLHLSVVQDVST